MSYVDADLQPDEPVDFERLYRARVDDWRPIRTGARLTRPISHLMRTRVDTWPLVHIAATLRDHGAEPAA
jgi:hypothetical protein